MVGITRVNAICARSYVASDFSTTRFVEKSNGKSERIQAICRHWSAALSQLGSLLLAIC